MKTTPIFTKALLLKPLMKTIVMLLLSFALTDCASTKKNLSSLKIKSITSFQQNHFSQSSNVSIEKDLIQADFEGKLRSTLSGSPFNKAIWSSSCDCR